MDGSPVVGIPRIEARETDALYCAGLRVAALTKRAFACGLVALLLVPASEKDGLAQDRPPGASRVVLLVDSSGAVASMVTSFREGLKVFLDALPGDTEIALVTTGGQFRMRVAPTSDRQKLLDAAAAFTADGGGNSVIRTMVEADSRLLKSADGRRGVLVVVTTDRGDYPNDNTVDIYNRFMPEFGRRGGRAHAVVIRPSGGGLISAVLENLSTNTGGFRETITIASALPAVMKKLTAFVAADQ